MKKKHIPFYEIDHEAIKRIDHLLVHAKEIAKDRLKTVSDENILEIAGLIHLQILKGNKN